MLALLFDAEWGKIILMMAATLLVTAALVGGGSYIFVRVLAVYINNRRDTWESAAEDLKLSVNRSGKAILKEFTGKRGDRDVKVEYFTVPDGRRSKDDCVAVTVQIREPFDFSFEITKPEMLYEKVANFFEMSDEVTGHEPFDKAFNVNCSHIPSLMELLNVEMLEGQSPTLLTDLMLARKRFLRVRITDKSVCLGLKADIGDSSLIETVIVKAVYLAERFESAARKIDGQ